MYPIKFAGMNTNYVADGSDDLPTLVEKSESGMLQITSVWEPSGEDLRILNQGGKVCLCLYGTQPPVAMWVQEVTPLNEATAE